MTEYQRFARLPHPEPRVLGPRVFWWAPYLPDPPTEMSAWLMVFFDQVVFVGATGFEVISSRRVDVRSASTKREKRIAKRLEKAGLIRQPTSAELGILLPTRPPRRSLD